MNVLLRLDWEESEKGWGIRPDGFSLHIDHESCAEYLHDHWLQHKEEQAPDIYSRPSGYVKIVDADQETFDKVKKCGSIRFYE